MKKTLCVLALLLGGFCVALSAQNKMQDVVYLKNGSMIRGMIVEQVPNESLKIRTKDGSLFVYTIDEISRITKESKVTTSPGSVDAGYRGFVDLGYTIGTSRFDDTGRIELSTSHGYQFNPYLFLGAGLAINYHIGWDEWNVPIFLNFRTNFINRPVTPFLDLRVGYTAGDGDGMYLYPALGMSFFPCRRFGLNFSFGYQMQWADFYDEDVVSNAGYDYYYYDDYTSKKMSGALSFRFGFIF
jgi:hypothetical protein